MSSEITIEMIEAHDRYTASLRRLQAYIEVDDRAGKAIHPSLEAFLHGLPKDAASLFDAAQAEANGDEILKLLLQDVKVNWAAFCAQ